jgi:Flp pilus assembly protein TadB
VLLTVLQGSLSLLLFMLLFITLRRLGLALGSLHAARSRLSTGKPKPARRHFVQGLPLQWHLQDMIEVTRFFPTVGAFTTCCMLFLLTGMILGVFFFQSLKGVAVLGPVCGIAPYVVLRMKLLSRQLRTRLQFLPAAEVFYQQLLLTEHPNIRNVLHAVIAEDRLVFPIKPSFQQLQRNLSAGREPEDALRIFELEHGHIWAHYFTNLMRLALQEGLNMASGLKELIDDMRRAQLFDQRARNRLLEIRLASFSPAFFLALFMGVNLKLNYENSVRFYFYSAEGKNMLLNAVVLMFGSLLLGIYLSIRRV